MGVGVVFCCAVLTACESGNSATQHRSSSASVPPPASSASLSTLPITSLPSSAVPSDPAALAATDALLTSAQLTGFQEIPWADTPIPQPCAAAGASPVLKTHPSQTHVGRQFHLAVPEAVLTEQIDLFATPADATKAT